MQSIRVFCIFIVTVFVKTCENLWLNSENSVKTIHAFKMNYYNEIRK